jgi:hypothetical protein
MSKQIANNLLIGLILTFLVVIPFVAQAVDCPAGFTKVKDLCLVNNPTNSQSVAGATDIQTFAVFAIKQLLLITGGLTVLFMIIGGFMYMTSGANPNGAKRGKETVQYAAIGLVVIVLSYAIVLAVSSFIINP